MGSKQLLMKKFCQIDYILVFWDLISSEMIWGNIYEQLDVWLIFDGYRSTYSISKVNKKHFDELE